MIGPILKMIYWTSLIGLEKYFLHESVRNHQKEKNLIFHWNNAVGTQDDFFFLTKLFMYAFPREKEKKEKNYMDEIQKRRDWIKLRGGGGGREDS